MKAQDTVMNFMRIEEIDAKNATSNFTDALVDVAWEQAQISFEAGIKEVVEWVKANSQVECCDPDTMAYFTEYRWVDEANWQSKLKEWGL